MDFSILYAIQTLRGPVMDALILGLTNIMGSYGQIWLVVGVALCLFPKTRRCGVAVLLSYGLVFLVGQYGLKDLIARPRRVPPSSPADRRPGTRSRHPAPAPQCPPRHIGHSHTG